MDALDLLIKFGLASVAPISLFLGGWWGSVGRLPDNRVFTAALAGLALGIAADLFWLRRWIGKPFEARG